MRRVMRILLPFLSFVLLTFASALVHHHLIREAAIHGMVEAALISVVLGVIGVRLTHGPWL